MPSTPNPEARSAKNSTRCSSSVTDRRMLLSSFTKSNGSYSSVDRFEYPVPKSSR